MVSVCSAICFDNSVEKIDKEEKNLFESWGDCKSETPLLFKDDNHFVRQEKV